MAEDTVHKEDFQAFKEEVSGQLAGVRADLRDLAQAMRELVRLDGDIKRLSDLTHRVAGESLEHERRIRALEIERAGTAKSIGLWEHLIKHAASLALGATLAAVALKTMGAH